MEHMKRMGIALVLLGVLVLGYGQLHPGTQVVAPVVGKNVTATVEQNAILLSPLAAGIIIVGGLALLAIPRRRTVALK